MYTFRLLGLSCETRRASGPPGASHSENSKRAHFRARRFKHHQNSTKRPLPREKKENCGGRGKKSATFWAPPTRPGSPPIGALHPSGPLLGPTLCGPKIQHPKIGRSRNWPKSITLASDPSSARPVRRTAHISLLFFFPPPASIFALRPGHRVKPGGFTKPRRRG